MGWAWYTGKQSLCDISTVSSVRMNKWYKARSVQVKHSTMKWFYLQEKCQITKESSSLAQENSSGEVTPLVTVVENTPVD